MSAKLELLALAREALEKRGAGSLVDKLQEVEKTIVSSTISELEIPPAIAERLNDIRFVRTFFDDSEFVAQQELSRQLEEVLDSWNASVISASYQKNLYDYFLIRVRDTLNEEAFDLKMSDERAFRSRKLGGLPTPTGKPTKLTATQQQWVRSDVFKSWFGDWIKAAETGDYTGVSKLVNPDTKEPELLFHGAASQKVFFRFDMKRTFSPVTYVASDYEYALWYAENEKYRGDRAAVKGGKPFVHQLFGVMRNPLDLRRMKLTRFTGDEVADLMYVLTGYRPQNIYARNPQGGILDKAPLIWYFRFNPMLLNELKERTYFDGVIFLGINPSMKTPSGPAIEDEYLFFSNTDLKLAHARFASGFIQDLRFEKGGKV